MTEPIKVQIIENHNKVDWNIWFLSIAVLSLIFAILVPFLQKKYEERKAKYGFHLYIKKRIGIVWNLFTYDKFEYKDFKDSTTLESLILTFDNLLYRFEIDYQKNKNAIHPLFAFGVLFNFQNMLFTIYRIQNTLKDIDINHLEEKTLEFGDKLSKKEHLKLMGLFMLIQHYCSIISFHDKFSLIKSIKREVKASRWVGLVVEHKVLDNQKVILEDLAYLRENEISIIEIININKLLIQELKLYFKHKIQ